MPTAKPEKKPTRTPGVVNWLQWAWAAGAAVDAELPAVLDAEADALSVGVVELGLEVGVAVAELIGSGEDDKLQLVPSHL